jgi:hypothetical protein
VAAKKYFGFTFSGCFATIDEHARMEQFASVKRGKYDAGSLCA